MPRIYSRRAAVTAVVSFLALSVVAISAAAGVPGTVFFTSANYMVDENAGSATITLRRTGGTDGEVTAKVSVTDGTAGRADHLLAPGALDTSFNTLTKANNLVRAVIQQQDGKILVGGSFSHYGGVARAGVARLN